GLHDVEQLEHYGGDAAEMAGPDLAVERRRMHRCRLNEVALRLRVHLGLVGREDGSDTGSGELLAIGGEGARVAIEILARAELDTIDEDACGDAVGMFGGLANERDMTVVQVAHGGYESDAAGTGARGPHACD